MKFRQRVKLRESMFYFSRLRRGKQNKISISLCAAFAAEWDLI
jgi:hypothetical protein